MGLAFGDRSSETCKVLWESLPADDRKRAVMYSDFWAAYEEVLPSKRHFAVGKDSGQRPRPVRCRYRVKKTNHVERFNNTLRQRCSNLVRETLSFSKCKLRHEERIRGFIDEYNAPLELAYRNSLI